MNYLARAILDRNGKIGMKLYDSINRRIPGVHIGDGAIIGANCVVGSDVDPYTIVVGNPTMILRKRFDDELIDLMLRFKWWDKSIDEIDSLIPLLTCSDLAKVRKELKARL